MNLTVTGSNMVVTGARRAKLVFVAWEPTTIYYQDYTNSWHESADGVHWIYTTDPRVSKSTAQIHGIGSVKLHTIVETFSRHITLQGNGSAVFNATVLSRTADSFSPGLAAGFGSIR